MIGARRLDVAIVGAGLAGTLLARQLRRTLPELSVGLFERATEPRSRSASRRSRSRATTSSGDSVSRRTSTSATCRRTACASSSTPPTRDAALERMSEIGMLSLPYHPSFQINRARLEADLRERNAADGVDVRTRRRVRDVELGDRRRPPPFRRRRRARRRALGAPLARRRRRPDEPARAARGSARRRARAHASPPPGGDSPASPTSTTSVRPRSAPACGTPAGCSRRCTSVTPATGSG